MSSGILNASDIVIRDIVYSTASFDQRRVKLVAATIAIVAVASQKKVGYVSRVGGRSLMR